MNTQTTDELVAALRASELRYRRVFESAKDGVLILDAETGQVVDVNPYLGELLGIAREDFLGKKIWELGFFRDIAANEAKFAELQAKAYVRYENLPLRTADGRSIAVEFVSNVYLVDRQRVIQCNIRDITVRKHTEEALRGSEQQFHRLVDLVPDAIFIQIAGRFAYLNEAAVRLFGAQKSAELLGQSVLDRVLPADHKAVRENSWLLTEARQAVAAHPLVVLRLDNSPVDVSAAGIPFRYADQNGALLVVRDITTHKHEEEILSASELRYRRLFEAAQDGILILDAETGMVVDVNPFLVNLLGYSHEIFLGKKIWELGFFKNLTANESNFRELQAKDYIRYEDLPLETADGKKIEVEFVSNVYLVNQTRVIQCNIRDITERKRMEEALRQSEARFHVLFEQAADSILMLEIVPEGAPVIRDANSATYRRLGYTRDELLGQPVTLLEAEAGATQVIATRRRSLQAKDGEIFELRHRCKDGSCRDFECSISELQIGGKTFALSVERDITDRKQSAESQARLVTAVEQAAETIVITDPAGTILYANPAFEAVTGYSRAEAYGQNPRVLKSGKHDAEFYRQMWATLTAGQVWRGHLINKRKNGTLYEEEATISPVFDAAGKIINFVAVKRDVTREVVLEEQNRQAEKLGAIGQLAGGVAHDFNNKLQVILGGVELILHGLPPDDPLRIELADVQDAARRSADLTRQLLAFSRKQAIAPVVLDLNAAIAGSLKMLGRLLGENIQLRFVQQPDLGRVFMDPSQLDQILANLAVNARDAIAGTGHIFIETNHRTLLEAECAEKTDFVTPGDYVVLTFRDDGPGMSEEIQSHIFEPFFTTKGVGQGTGLGLATVYGIVKQNHGAITVTARPNRAPPSPFICRAPTRPSPATLWKKISVCPPARKRFSWRRTR